MMERVVVTGLGIVSCAGSDVPTFWESLCEGKSGIGRISAFDPSILTSQIAGEVKDFTFDPKQAKRLGRFTQFALDASRQALEQAGLMPEAADSSAVNPQRIGVSIGSGIGGFTFLVEQHEKFLQKGPGRYHPLTVPIIISNMAAANVSIHYKLHGPNVNISTACATGNHNIGYALDVIRLGRADAMLAGGVESTINPFAVDGYIQLRALSTRNDDPTGASRPFSASRDGFVLAEGGGVLLLESLSHAQARGAEILAEIAGYGMTSDGYHLTAPDPEGAGAARAMQLALDDAGTNPEDVSYINAHGTSTLLNDKLETQAIKRVFGGHAKRLQVSSIKSMVGHGLGAAAGLEAVACVLALRDGVIPPTINLNDPDPELDLDFVPNEARKADITTALSNAFAFGGQNASVMFRKFS
ncbi:MAG: beta-ketoacyl-ACP synthase II [SAR324 cluster bacterium]|nr:beta-ketoacyl-ACP synthase II [SAR324 cluster bacterium]MCZ6629291.1 beta-ketoacyl-ACP synthase II [SAR324 cluster bacterium]